MAVIEVSEESPRRIAGDEAACRASPPDPAALADPLVSARPNTGWDVFTDGPARYADVLDPAGLARCAELLGQQKGKKSHTLAELRDSLTRAQAALAATDTTAFTARVRELHTLYAKRPVADGTV